MRRTSWLLVLLALNACEPYSDRHDELRHAREQWQDADLDHYGFTLAYICECSRAGTFQIVVHADTVTSAVRLGPEEAPEWGEIPEMTIDDLFEAIEEALDEDPAVADLEFHRLGYPTRIWFDVRKSYVDDEWGFIVSDLAELSRND